VANNHPVTILIDDVDAKELNNQTITLEANQKENQDPIILVANSWWQTGVDPPEDLTQLNHLHEPAVVLCLRKRYERNQIYTYTGKILIALNPFKQIRDLYGRSVIEHYLPSTLSSGGDSKAPPHVYATAQDAYSSMMQDKKNQSILVSGESGAGKTVTTKIVLAYLTIVSTWNQREGEKVLDGASGAVPSIESQVVHSTPILESFGNARTVRNDNSSRFGKFIDVRFLQSGKLQSASIQTYLLEKVRLISQAPGERNFHVFFELLNGLSQRERKDFLLGNLAPQDFRMTSNSGTFDRRDGVDDRATYRSLRESLSTIGLSASETKDVFSVCCALLFCSNLTFLESASGETELDNSNHSLSSVVELLGVDVLSLNNALCFTAIEARGETLYKTLSRSQASKALEALMKAAYSALFQYIVSRINDSISHEKGSNRRDAGLLSIGVLDIFGFESFDKNSFEQLCINFCNEHLQQQFNQFVFKEEQREYQQEGIEWKYISFPDNQDVLDLIEKKHEGIISVLNEQNLLPRCTDQSFCMAVYEKCSSHLRFHATKGQRIAGQFCIAHYAGDVEYSTTGFLEKNKDELPKETTDLFKSSTSRFIVVLGEILDSPSSLRLQEASVSNKKIRRSSSSLVRESVSSQFCSQLRELRAKIDATSPHYIRCFKPNDLLVPTTFVASVVADQLRCAGVLEAIRVSRVGFPHRFSFSQFTLRYQMLAKNHMPRHRRFYSERDLCEVVVNAVSLLIRRSHEIQLPKNPSAETDPSK
jgi:myosin-5